MKNIVEVVYKNKWDPVQIKRDWEEKIAPQITRVFALNLTKPRENNHSDYTFSEMPVLEDFVKDTIFEEILNSVPSKLGRCTLIALPPSFCLPIHRDTDYKYHVAINDLPGNYFYDYEEQKGYTLPADGSLYKINSRKRFHTASNPTPIPRAHLVVAEYPCEDSNPNTIHTSKIKFDFSKCPFKTDIKRASFPNTLEQAFVLDWASDSYYTGKVFTNRTENVTLDGEVTGREYTMEWICRDTMMSRIFNPEFIQLALSLKNIGVDLYYDIGDGYQLAA